MTGSIAIAGAQVSDLGRSVVIARGQDQLTCVLTEGDAAAKFARMMSAEAGR